MNKFTENECLPNFELKFKSLENLRKPLLLKSTRGRIVEKKQNGKDEGRKPNHSSCRGKQTSMAKENGIGIDAGKSQVSIPENQTIFGHSARRSFNDAIHEEAKRSWQQTKCCSTS